MKMLQYKLYSGASTLVCWLDTDRKQKLHIGTRLTLKGIDDVVWTICEIYGPELGHIPDFTWKVGGLK